MLNMKEKLYSWVEKKIGEKVELEIEKMENNPSFDIKSYANDLVNDVFNDAELQKLREKIVAEKDFESEFSVTETEDDFLIDVDGLDIMALSLDERADLTASEQTFRQLLQSFEYLTVDEVINQPSWSEARKVLQDMLIDKDEHGKSAFCSLKVFKRLISSNHSPKTVCEGFVTLTESIINQIESINKRANTVESEELYDIRENKVYRRSSQRFRVEPAVEKVSLDTLFQSVHLLISAHTNMPGTWLRFNERRLHDIIWSFVHMLSLSYRVEKRNVSAFDIVTALQPRGTWAAQWTHSAIGRNLLAQIFRKHRRFFYSIVETVISNIITMQEKKPHKRSAHEKSSSAPPSAQKEKSSVSVIGVPEDALTKARFCHCFSILTHLLQYRAGRALFPLQTSSRRRPWTVQDVVGLMIDHIEMIHSKMSHLYSPFYTHHLMEMARILLSVEEEISTARGTQLVRKR